MKKLIFLLPTVLLLWGCHNKETEQALMNTADSLRAVSEGHLAHIDELDSSINDFIEDFNAIQSNLDSIKEKENIVSELSSSGELGKSKKAQIVADIASIYDLMNRNQASLAKMQGRLNNSYYKNKNLQKLVDGLQADIESKTVEINELREQMELLNVKMTNLQLAHKEETETNLKQFEEVKTDLKSTLHTVYYTVGTKDELLNNDVLTKEGGFIGIGKTKKLKADFNKDYFTKVDSRELSNIELSSVKKAQVLTTHPSSSFSFEGEEKEITGLEISDAEDFWSASKYLVILVE